MKQHHMTFILVSVLAMGAMSAALAGPGLSSTALLVQQHDSTLPDNAMLLASGEAVHVMRPLLPHTTMVPQLQSTRTLDFEMSSRDAKTYNHSSMLGGHNSLLAAVGMIAVMAVVMVVVMR